MVRIRQDEAGSGGDFHHPPLISPSPGEMGARSKFWQPAGSPGFPRAAADLHRPQRRAAICRIRRESPWGGHGFSICFGSPIDFIGDTGYGHEGKNVVAVRKKKGWYILWSSFARPQDVPFLPSHVPGVKPQKAPFPLCQKSKEKIWER